MNALRVVHETRYDYGAPVGYGLQRLRVRPKSDAWQRVIDWSVTIEGGADGIRFGDEHGNDTDLIVLDRDVERLGLRVEGTVEPLVSDGVYGPHDGLAPLALYVHPTLLTMAGRGVVSLAGSGTDLAAMHDLSARILDRVTFDTAVGEAAQNAEIIIKQGAGVCQDHAHVMIACARY
ncbi:MAG: transglutaminase N-terminal domain-containing protein, partial [Pseudomonadota bacterium]